MQDPTQPGYMTSEPPPSMPPESEEVIGGIYRAIKELGRGAMGRILLGEDTVLKRRVAIKLPLNDQAAAMLLSEGRALAALDHPGLPGIHAAGKHEGRPFLVMELLNGTSLEERLEKTQARGVALGLPEVLRLLTCIAEALDAIHSAGIAHRDIKPENVLLCKRGPVLIDFGLVVPEYNATDQRVYGGSPLYVSPEVIQRNESRGAGALSDLYSFGIMAYELLTSTVPFDADTIEDILRLHVKAPIPDVRMLRPTVPAGLAELLKELMAKRAGERVQSAEEVVWRLRTISKQVDKREADDNARVLILSSDPGVRSQLEVGLRCWVQDIDVAFCSSSREAFTAMEKDPPSLMVVDLDLGGTSGVEFLMQLRGSDLPWPRAVVALPQDAEAADLDLVRHLDVRCFVPKGPQMMTLLEKVVRNSLVAPAERSRASLA